MQSSLVEGFRLSPQQKHLWHLQPHREQSPFFVQEAFLVEGQLDIDVFQVSLQQVMARHEILRTFFMLLSELDIPLQGISEEIPSISFTYNKVDLSSLSPTDQKAYITSLWQTWRQEPYWLEKQGSPLKVSLIKLNTPEQHLLLLSLPALYTDASGLRNLVQDVGQVYTANLRGVQPLEPPLQYADVSEWQNEILEDVDTKPGHGYWQRQNLVSFVTSKLPLEETPGFENSFQPQHISHFITPDRLEKINGLAEENHASLPVFLLACWQILLWRLTGQNEVVVGVGSDGRKYEELIQVVGLLTKYLPVRCQFEGDSTFSQVLEAVAHVMQEAREWEESFVWEHLTKQNNNREPFLPFCFNFVDQLHSFSLMDLTFTRLEQYDCVDQFKVKLTCAPENGTLNLIFHYDSRLFSRASIETLKVQFLTLLQAILDNSAIPISQLTMMSAEELQKVLVDFNPAKTQIPLQDCIHHLIAEQAKHYPDRLALVFEDQQLTYAQLNERTNQLAHKLQEMGVGLEKVVALCLERSLEAIIGILGVFKAGGAYLPVDPKLPPSRIAFMIEDAQADIVITQEKWLDILPVSDTHIVLCLDRDWAAIVDYSTTDPQVPIAPENLAYIIYTSGSTGKPKGVLIEHRSLIILLNALERIVYKDKEAPLRASLNAPLFFDASVQQLILLARGHLLNIISEEIRIDGERFLEWKETHALDVIDCTPSQLRLLVAAGLLDASPSLFLIAGEAIDPLLWIALLEISHITFFNIYGPTECTVDASACQIQPSLLTPSIGWILPDYKAYVLDQYLKPLPIGIAGELYLGGLGIARNYLNQPRLTASKFIPSPFGPERLYKTGDIVRYYSDGRLEYLGRIDNQVKLRGFRIELGEIEVALRNHQAIRDAIVMLYENSPTQKQLVAYFIPQAEDQIPSYIELQAFLKQHLPDYMMPANFISLTSIPLTPNGKLDRQALPVPSRERPELDNPYIAPRTEAEKILALIWSDILDVEQVGIDDNYFSLGGDSIRSIQVQTAVKEKGWAFALQDLFKYQTIRALSNAMTLLVDRVTSTVTPFSLISNRDRQVLPERIEDAYPLSILQLGMVFHSELTPETPVYQDVFSVYLRIPFNHQALEMTLSKLVQYHPVLRTSFDITHYEEPLQLVHKTAKIPLKITDLSHYAQDKQQQIVAEIVETEKRKGFDWKQPPFLRLQVCKHSEDTFSLVVTEHQSILDGWSLATLMSELFQQYLFYLGMGKEPVKPPPTAMLRDAIALEQKTINSEAARAFWHQFLEDSSFTQMPCQHSASQLGRYIVYPVPILPELSRQLEQLARGLSVPLKTILLASHIRVMSLLSGQSDIVTGYVTNTRPEVPDGERVIGLFLNTVPFRLQLENCTWSGLIQQTFQAELEILPYRHYPMGRLQNERGGMALFETAFNFTHFHVYDTLPDIDGVEVLAQQFFEQTNLPLMVDFGLTSGDARVRLTLSCTGFEEAQIEAFAGYYIEALKGMVQQPNESYQNTLLLGSKEKERLLYLWNQTEQVYPHDTYYSQLFEQQAAKTPDATAVCCGDLQLTYNELNRRANLLSKTLAQAGVCSDLAVALLANRSVDLLVGILAIFKAGGAYLPLDPRHPTRRQVQVLEQSHVKLVLATTDFVASLSDTVGERNHAIQILPLEVSLATELKDENPSRLMEFSNTAYIIYTSGSTGAPKGAMIEQRGMVNHIFAKIHDLQLTEADRVAQTASQCFDISVWQFLAPLLVGGQVHILEDDVILNPRHLLTTMIEQEITILETVPSLMRVLFEEIKRDKAEGFSLSKLRWFIPTGEALPPDLCHEWFSHYESIPLLNAYGPTECSDDVSHYRMLERPLETAVSIPIGRPVANTQLYILDSNLNPVPTEVIGELYVGGMGVGRGYLNDPRQTALVFVPDPFGHNPGMRLYQTGDLACYLPDGNIQFLGRRDHQVKIRGHRIELEEIRITLNQHPNISDSVVTVHLPDIPSESGGAVDKRLVAYVVPLQPNTSLATKELRQFLTERLPEYMIPPIFVPLASLPLNANGKIDRKALPEPDQERPILVQSFAVPTTPTEEILVEMFREIIRVDMVGIHDSFFDLGGHSLLATQLIARIRNIFQIELPLRELFVSPTVAELALSIEEFIIVELENIDN